MVVKTFSRHFQQFITSKSYSTYTYQHFHHFVENNVMAYQQDFSYYIRM